MRTFFLSVICVVFFISPSWAAEQDMQHYLDLFERPDVFRAQYEEVKHIPSLAAPLRSKGDFIYIKDKGLMWVMAEPFSMKTLITPRGLTQWVEGQEQPQSDEMRQAMKPILENISAIFSGDFEQLSQNFSISEQPADGAGWALVLRPKSALLDPYLKEIKITGAQYIERVVIVQDQDKYTEATYVSPDIGERIITDEERALFNE